MSEFQDSLHSLQEHVNETNGLEGDSARWVVELNTLRSEIEKISKKYHTERIALSVKFRNINTNPEYEKSEEDLQEEILLHRQEKIIGEIDQMLIILNKKDYIPAPGVTLSHNYKAIEPGVVNFEDSISHLRMSISQYETDMAAKSLKQ